MVDGSSQELVTLTKKVIGNMINVAKNGKKDVGKNISGRVNKIYLLKKI
jgi:hypothetical protein